MRTTMIAPVCDNNNKINTRVCPLACSQLLKSRQRTHHSETHYDDESAALFPCKIHLIFPSAAVGASLLT